MKRFALLLLLLGCATSIAPPPQPGEAPDARAALGTSGPLDSALNEGASVAPPPDASSPDTQPVAQDTHQTQTLDVAADAHPATLPDSQSPPPDVLPSPTDSGPPACVPGASAACACATGLKGAQVCSAAGTFGPCDCQPLPPDAPVVSLLITGLADMGNVAIGTASESTFTIQNTGAVDVTDIVMRAMEVSFSVVHNKCANATLASRAQCTFGVKFTAEVGQDLGNWPTILIADAPGGITSNHLKISAWVVEPCGNNCDGGRG